MITDKVIAFKTISIFSAVALMVLSCARQTSAVSDSDPWKKKELIIKSIPQTHFADKVYSITDFGAVADGKTLNTLAFEKAIKACAENGGGQVLVPNGKFLTGAIHLESNVNLHLADKAEVLFLSLIHISEPTRLELESRVASCGC